MTWEFFKGRFHLYLNRGTYYCKTPSLACDFPASAELGSEPRMPLQKAPWSFQAFPKSWSRRGPLILAWPGRLPLAYSTRVAVMTVATCGIGAPPRLLPSSSLPPPPPSSSSCLLLCLGCCCAPAASLTLWMRCIELPTRATVYETNVCKLVTACMCQAFGYIMCVFM